MNRARRQRPSRPDAALGRLLGPSGWLFADLLLAAMAIFLVSTVGTKPPTPPPTTTTTTTTTMVPPATRPRLAQLSKLPVTLFFHADPDTLLHGSAVQQAPLRTLIRSATRSHHLAGHRAGIVLTFSAGPLGVQLSHHVNALLHATEPAVFTATTVLRDYHDLSAPPGSIKVEIYLLLTTP